MPDVSSAGRYIAATSPVHRLDPRVKLALTAVAMAAAIVARTPAGLALVAAGTVAAYAAARIPARTAASAVAPLMVFVALTCVLNLFSDGGGAVLWQAGPLRITEGGLAAAAVSSVRLTCLLFVVALLTFTTTSLDITAALEWAFTPLARLGFPAHELGMVMGIALRFVPQFATELAQIRRAQASRGARFASNPFAGGLSDLSALVVPLFASVFRHAQALAEAMEARCYRGGGGRTRLHPFGFRRADAVACAAVGAFFALVVAVTLI